MAERASKRRSARQLAGRKRSVYFEPDSDDAFENESDSEGEQDYQPPREHNPLSAEVQRPAKKRKQNRSHKPATRSRAKRRPTVGHVGRKKKTHLFSKVPATPKKVKERSVAAFSGPSDGVRPAWTNLPIEILRDIFIFASHPIHEQTTTSSDNVRWLLRAARTCHAFAIPALEAYYQAPAFHTSRQPHDLLDLVKEPEVRTYVKYAVKVKSLEFDIKRLAYTAHNRPLFDVGALTKRLPQLRDLEIVHPMDAPPYRPLKFQRWWYPIRPVDNGLDLGDVILRSWRWNRDMIPIVAPASLYTWMNEVHTSKNFAYLRKLVVCGFDVQDSAEPPPPTSEDHTESQLPGLASVISALPSIIDLTFTSCDMVMENFLERLPKTLQRLEINNCLEVTSDMMRTYLLSGGSQLRELILNNNPSLNLSFLQVLREACPRLKVLKMDLTYYSERFNYNDAWALYDQVLTADEIPTWPSALQYLELKNLQKWQAPAAQSLFRSLVDSAKDLPDLRYLSLQAHIDIPWRARAGFRDQWIERLRRVYLRKSEDPIPYLGSLRQFRLWKAARAKNLAQNVAGPSNAADADSDYDEPMRRRLSHVRVTPRKATRDADLYSDEVSAPERPRQRQPRRSARVASSRSASPPPEESESESGSESGGDDDWRKQPEAFIQGLCEVVDIRIDNQRPRENQYTEANFLDSEPSGDEDWHEGAELSDDGYAW